MPPCLLAAIPLCTRSHNQQSIEQAVQKMSSLGMPPSSGVYFGQLLGEGLGCICWSRHAWWLAQPCQLPLSHAAGLSIDSPAVCHAHPLVLPAGMADHLTYTLGAHGYGAYSERGSLD